MVTTSELPGGARLMVGFEGHAPSDALKRVLSETGARSVILFARNIRDATQAHDLIAAIRALVPWPLLIAVDQEGGPVVRIAKGATVFPGNMALGAVGDVDLAYRSGSESGRQLRAVGFDLNLAPVVDLQTNPRNPGIGIRSLGAERGPAARLARALIEGHERFSVASCLKHFPGKGAADVDAHIDLPFIDLPRDAFYDPHVQIFADLLSAAPTLAVMTTHVVVRALDPANPATFSAPLVRGLLREETGFQGLVLADDLEMGAVVKHGTVGDAALKAAVAGHDVLPICHDPQRQLEAAKRLDQALRSGELDLPEHRRSTARILALAARAANADRRFDRTAGDAIAREIARRAVHSFGDRRGLLPLRATARTAVLAVKPFNTVGVEEEADRDWQGLWERTLEAAGFTAATVIPFAADLGDAESAALLDRASNHERIVLTTWNARGVSSMARLLVEAANRFADRLIVLHLRNPFDQALAPEGVTALTAFGYRIHQIEALTDCLAGALSPTGHFP